MLVLLLFISLCVTPSSAVLCYSCVNNRDIACRLVDRTADRGFSRFECSGSCNKTESCSYCQVLLTNTAANNFYKMTYVGCPSPGRSGLNASCSATYAKEFGNSSYIHRLFTLDYKNTSLLPQTAAGHRRSALFPPFICACDASFCNQRITFSFLHDPTPLSTPTSLTDPTTNRTQQQQHNATTAVSLVPLQHLPPEYFAFIAAAIALAFLLSVLLVFPPLLWRCHRNKSSFSPYQLARDKSAACPHEMATLSSPNVFHEDPELSRVPILTDLQLRGIIGSGKYGHVCRCSYQGREMACKVWLPFEMYSWRSERAIFSQETTYHPNIVRYIHSGFLEESTELGPVTKGVLLMELCSRGSLSNFLDTNTLSWETASRFSFEIASGISYLHSHTGLARAQKGYTPVVKCPIAHRDIKSSNVLIRANLSCCISDLGLALALNPDHSEESFANSGQVGTPFYMAPEALSAKINLKDLDSFKQMDVFSLGLVLWEIFSRCKMEPWAVLCSEHKIPFSDQVPRRHLDKSRNSRVELIHVLKVLHREPIEKLLSLPPEWGQHPQLSRARTTILDCTYKEPEARITAGTVTSRFEQSMPNTKFNECEKSFCESIDFGSFASMSSLMRMIETQRLSKISCDNYTQLHEFSI